MRLADWLPFLSTTSVQGSGVSLFADQQFDEAYNTTLIEKDLPHVRWGRIDYMNVTHLTTKWAVWKYGALFIPFVPPTNIESHVAHPYLLPCLTGGNLFDFGAPARSD